jgi:AcrR family transcriptional regulator
MPAALPPQPPSAPPARRSHAQRSAATRAQLLTAAARVVRERGAQGASLFEVAKAAGVTPGALQHHFGSKAELMMQLVEHLLSATDGSGVRWPAPSRPLAARARAFVDVLWHSVYAEPRFLAAWAVYFGSSGDAALMQRLSLRRAAVNEGLRRRLREVFPELRDARRAADQCDLLLAALRGLALLRLFDLDAAPGPGLRRQLAGNIVSACGAGAALPTSPAPQASQAPPRKTRA